MKFTGLVLAATLMLSCAFVLADEAPPKPAPPAEKISVPTVVQPKEARSYSVSVAIKGKAPVQGEEPVDVDMLTTMKIRQQFGTRAADGLLMLEMSASDTQATVGTEKVEVPAEDYPRLTMLLDPSWKVTSIFGLAGTRYASPVPGLNYGNLIMLFFIPESVKPHAIGEPWSGKIKLPGIPNEASVTTTLKSIGETGGVKSVAVHQDYVWNQQKMADGITADSKAAVDSTFALETGKLLKSHAESEITFQDASKTKPEEKQYKAISKIDIVLEKHAPAP